MYIIILLVKNKDDFLFWHTVDLKKLSISFASNDKTCQKISCTYGLLIMSNHFNIKYNQECFKSWKYRPKEMSKYDLKYLIEM